MKTYRVHMSSMDLQHGFSLQPLNMNFQISPGYDHVLTITDLPDITRQQIEHFFEHYKDLEPGKWVKIGDWHGVEDAKRLVAESIERAKA